MVDVRLSALGSPAQLNKLSFWDDRTDSFCSLSATHPAGGCVRTGCFSAKAADRDERIVGTSSKLRLAAVHGCAFVARSSGKRFGAAMSALLAGTRVWLAAVEPARPSPPSELVGIIPGPKSQAIC